MNASDKEILQNQFGASLDMLENAVAMCPDRLWEVNKFWYISYHVMFWTDYYLTLDPATFTPPPPFTLVEFEADGPADRAYTKTELLDYLHFIRKKLHTVIAGLTDEIANQRWINDRKDYPFYEIILYNMRHIQHHAAQLNLLLRQGMDDAPGWVSRAKAF